MDGLSRTTSDQGRSAPSMPFRHSEMFSETGLQYTLSDRSPNQKPEQNIASPPPAFLDQRTSSSLSSSTTDTFGSGQLTFSSPTSMAIRTNPPGSPRNAKQIDPQTQLYPNTGRSLNINQFSEAPRVRHDQLKNGDFAPPLPSAQLSQSSSVSSHPTFGWQTSGFTNDRHSPMGSVTQLSIAQGSNSLLSTNITDTSGFPPALHSCTTGQITQVPPHSGNIYPGPGLPLSVQPTSRYIPPVSSYASSSATNSFGELSSNTSQIAESRDQSVPSLYSPVGTCGPSIYSTPPVLNSYHTSPAPPSKPNSQAPITPSGLQSNTISGTQGTPPRFPPVPPDGTSTFNGASPLNTGIPGVTSVFPTNTDSPSQHSYPSNPEKSNTDTRLPPFPPHPAAASTTPVYPSVHTNHDPSLHPFPPQRPHMPPQIRQGGSVDHCAFFRTPGTAATAAEWNRVKSPIGLLQEQNLLPSDTAVHPPKPMISNPINCDSDIMRCTLTNFPSTAKLLSRCRLPLGLVMHPFRDLSSLHTITSTVIVRCRSCRTYINPFVQFVDSGRRWRCPVCFLSNTVPDDFFYDPSTQSYGDPSRRPEIRSATVEFIAPPEYMIRPPQPATYLFCFDVSRNAIATGYLRFTCERLVSALNKIPGDSRRQVGFITFDSAIHFYKLCGDTMKSMVCPDLDEPFIPDNEGLMNRLDDSSEAIKDFLLRLPDMFEDTSDIGNCLGATLQIALKMIGGTGGRVTVFNTCLPNTGAGKLQIREDQNDRISADVKNLGPAIDFYKTFALDCAAQQVAVDFFIMNSQYCDIATLSGAARFSSGCVYHYPDFYCPPSACQTSPPEAAKESESREPGTTHSVRDMHEQANNLPIELERFRRDFDRYLSRKIGFEAVMRIRCTHGLSIQTFHGSFFVRSIDLMSLPNVNPDAGFAVQLNISESLESYATVCCQAAILYTSSQGDRRIRVHTLCLPVVHNVAEVFQGADQGAIACLISKMAVDRAINSGISNAREAVATSVADALSAYSSAIGITPPISISSYSVACPPSLRLLALYICGLLRYTALKVGVPVRIDDRSAALERLKTAPPDDLLVLLYPRLYAVHQFISKPIGSSTLTLSQQAAALRLSDYGDAQLDTDQHSDDAESSVSSHSSEVGFDAEQLPGQLHLSSRSLSRSGVFLLDTGEILYLLVGSGEDSGASGGGSSELLQQLLGISKASELPACGGPFNLPPLPLRTEKSLSSPHNDTIPTARRRLVTLINLIRRQRPMNSALVCMRHDAPATLRTRFLSALIEDRTEFAPSYFEFLQMIQNLMKN